MDRPKDSLSPKIDADKAWYLALLDKDAQRAYEEAHLANVLRRLKRVYLLRIQQRIAQAKAEIAALREKEGYSAEDFRAVQEKNAEVAALKKKLEEYRPFFSEPYFARMDVVDDKEGYNSYYIGKHGDVNLEIVDWRAPLPVRYYQNSRVTFTINEYDYRTVLRRALSVKNGKLLDFRNEYLSVKDVLSPEEIAGRDEEILFDPYLRDIIRSRKDDVKVRDIIRTIQEKQFDIITLPERESFVLQGCAGSGKTMIMLHRLSYLMYNNESLRPGDVLVITPSDSFNAFIDELSQMLELERVRTTTLGEYYFRVLKGEGIDLKARILPEREDGAYLAYLYSPAFPADLKARINKLYEEIRALFAAEECRAVAREVLEGCRRRMEKFTRVKNASLRVRRAVLGELKENKQGGFYFTKPFRAMMSAFVQAEDFLRFVLDEPPRTPDYFFRQFAEFYRCAHFIVANGEKVFARADEDLCALLSAIDKEIADLRRYRRKIGTEEVLTYADRIARLMIDPLEPAMAVHIALSCHLHLIEGNSGGLLRLHLPGFQKLGIFVTDPVAVGKAHLRLLQLRCIGFQRNIALFLLGIVGNIILRYRSIDIPAPGNALQGDHIIREAGAQKINVLLLVSFDHLFLAVLDLYLVHRLYRLSGHGLSCVCLPD